MSSVSMETVGNITSLEDEEQMDKDFTEYTLTLANNRSFHVPGRVLKHSKLLETLVTNTSDEQFTFESIDGNTMAYVLCYMEYVTFFPNIQHPIHPTLYKKSSTHIWFREYIEQFTKQQLLEIANIAHYLDIEHLLHLVCFRLSNMH
tara:strand:- start:1611 stop:2051 length:441 start_codon:yes stop_codon:yes gene_type:complete